MCGGGWRALPLPSPSPAPPSSDRDTAEEALKQREEKIGAHRASGALTSGSPVGAGGRSGRPGSAWCSSASPLCCTPPSWCRGCGPGGNGAICCCGGGGSGLVWVRGRSKVQIIRAQAPHSTPKPMDSVSPIPGKASWTRIYITRFSGEEVGSGPPGPPTFLVTFLRAIVGKQALQEGVLRGPWDQCLLFQQPQQAPRLICAGQRADL